MLCWNYFQKPIKRTKKNHHGEKGAVEDFRNNPKCIFVAKCAFMYFSQMIQKTQYRFDTNHLGLAQVARAPPSHL